MKKVKHISLPSAPPGAGFITTYRNALWVIGIALLVVIIYRSVMGFQLVNWDDRRYVKETSMVQGLTMENVKAMFTTKVLRSYNPLVLFTFALDYKFAHLKPEWSHGVNLFLHLINALLVFVCMRKLRFTPDESGLIAALFAVHPLLVEAVAWIAGRKDVLYGFFFLLAWMSYIDFFKSHKKYKYFFSLFFFLCSLFSKVQAITFPFILILTDYILSREWKAKSIINKIPFFVLSIAFGIIGVSGGALVADKYSLPPTFPEKLSYSLMGFGLYLQKLFLPVAQCAIYSFPENGSGEYFRLVITGALALIVFGITIYYSVKKAPMVAAGLLVYSVFISVILHVVAFNSALIYERFTYLACIGLFMAIVSVDKLFPAWRKYKLKSLGIIVIIFCFLTYNRTKIWANSETMWSDVIEKNPRASEAYNNRGMVLLDKDENDKAFSDFNESIRLKPNQPDAYNNRSVVYFREKNYQKALEDNAIVLKLDPHHHDGLTNRACFFFTVQNYDSAIYWYSKAAHEMPRNASALYFEGVSYYKLGDNINAKKYYRQAIDIFPDYADAYAYLGLAYVQLDQFDSAEYCVREAENINQASSARQLVSLECVHRGNSVFDKGDSGKALLYYSKAGEIDSTNAEAFYDMGGIFLTRHDMNKARELWKKTLSINPQHKDAQLWLSRIH
jgi:tetratricopeptide (TPR) repeat protein